MTPINLQGLLQDSSVNTITSLPQSQNINNQVNQVDQNKNSENQNTSNATFSFQNIEKQIEKSIQQLMENLSYLNTHLNIQLDKKADTVVIKIIDNKTNQVIKEIPPDYVLKIAEAINNLIGIFVNKKV